MNLLAEIINFISLWAIPFIILCVPFYALFKKVPVYETFIEGAKEGFDVSVKIIPYLVAILVAIGMFRASGAIDMLAEIFSPVLKVVSMPVDVFPLAIIRSLSGSGALGVFTEIANAHGGNSIVAKTAAVMVGCSETTFYVLAVYFGSVGVTKFRHAVLAGIIADIAGIIAALFISNLVFV